MKARLLPALLFASSLAFSAAAVIPAAAAAETASSDANAPATADPDKIVCKTHKKTGTRLAKRTAKICKTKAEWDRIALETEMNNQDMQRSLGQTGPKG